ncbi:MAG: fructosamine kinase family protein [Gammaproteobacteria bacterium]|nr:fructosamine kinase family protein [Gammaproteobacteria bacterium]
MRRPLLMPPWEAIAETIRQHGGEPFVLRERHALGGGCINSAWRVADGGRQWFVKLNTGDKLDMFEAERDGLLELAASGAVRVPQPLATGLAAGQAFIVMEALELGGHGSQVQLGEQLAVLHRHRADRFGWYRDNTIGSTHQPNRQHPDWLDFWREERLGFQLALARENGAPRGLLSDGERLLADFHRLFGGYLPTPSLLHGDLWSGNYAFASSGEPVIFDPAVYYGDREAELAMTELFGGFGSEFYAAYNEAWPLDPGYPVRKSLYNLYHILNHFTMFGGGYGSQAEGMMGRLLAELG